MLPEIDPMRARFGAVDGYFVFLCTVGEVLAGRDIIELLTNIVVRDGIFLVAIA